MLIRQATKSDAAFFFQLMNSPGWIQFIGDRNIKSLAAAEAYVQNTIQSVYPDLGFLLVEFDANPIGIVGCVKREYLEEPDFGFALLPEYEGKGLAFLACQEYLKSREENFLAIVNQDNSRSVNLLNRLGFLEIGLVKPPEESQELLLFQRQPV